jgi:hypothetical protein
MNAQLYPMPRNGFDQKGLKKFKKDFSEFEDLYNVEGNLQIMKI